MTIAVNYVGNQSHFIINSGTTGANARGYWANQLNPAYLRRSRRSARQQSVPNRFLPHLQHRQTLRSCKAKSGVTIPPFFQAAAVNSTTATIAQGLVAFPQYCGVSDTWGNVGNFSYNSLQITLLQRFAHGLSFNVNYTYSKNIGDDGTFRSGFDIPAAAISGGGQNWKQDRIERSWTTVSAPQSLHAFGVYQLPFGKGHIGRDSMLVRALASGWQLSGIYTYGSGTPVAVIWNGCGTGNINHPGQGQCMQDLNPAYLGKTARSQRKLSEPHPKAISPPTSARYQYFDFNAFQTPKNISTSSTAQYLLGNAPRTRPWNLNNPGEPEPGHLRSSQLQPASRDGFGLRSRLPEYLEQSDLLKPKRRLVSGSATFGTIAGISNSIRATSNSLDTSTSNFTAAFHRGNRIGNRSPTLAQKNPGAHPPGFSVTRQQPRPQTTLIHNGIPDPLRFYSLLPIPTHSAVA